MSFDRPSATLSAADTLRVPLPRGRSGRRSRRRIRLGPAWAAALAAGCVAAALTIARHPTFGFLAVAGAAAACVVLIRPRLATPLVVFLLASNTPAVLVNRHGVPAAAAALVPFLLVLPLMSTLLRRERLMVTPVALLLALYLVVQIVAGLQAIDMGIVENRLLTFVLEGLLTLFLITNVVRTYKTLRDATWALVAGLGFLGMVTLVQYLTHSWYRTFFGFGQVSSDYFYGLVDQPRLQGPIGDPNYFAQVLLLGIPLGFALAATARSSRERATALAATGCMFAGILFTYSRGAVVAFLLAFALLVALRQIKVRYGVVLAILLVVVVATVPSYRSRVESLTSVGGAGAQVGTTAASDSSVGGRVTEMHAALLVWADHPVFGVGPSQFPLYYQRYALVVGGQVHTSVAYGPSKGSSPGRVTHDLFLGIAADLGVVGLIVFLSILAVTLRGLWRPCSDRVNVSPALAAVNAGYLVAIVAYIAAGLFLELAYERYFWLILALACSAVRVAGIASAQTAVANNGRAAAEPR
ncbi:MAG: O-antigen ligase family protein [Actinomycetota bacterium]|nr:O-antigen ligase family protein [Actinomycetota bacterium]